MIRKLTAAAAAVFASSSAHAQCPVSVRAVLDDYPGYSESTSLYGTPSINWHTESAPSRDLLVLGGVTRVGANPGYTTSFGTVTWDGRRAGRITENGFAPYPSSWSSMGVDPQDGHFFAGQLSTVSELVGAHWQTVTPMPTTGVKQLAVWNGRLVMGGGSAGDGSLPSIAIRDNGQWSPLPPFRLIQGSLHYSTVYGMCEHDGRLIAGADDGLYAWDGASWQYLHALPDHRSPIAMTSYQGALWVGQCTVAGDVHLYRRAGSAWIPAPTPPGTLKLNDLNVVNGELLASGDFGLMPSSGSSVLMKWTGTGWTTPGTGVAGAAGAIGLWGGMPVVAGPRHDPSVRGALVLDGNAWTDAGSVYPNGLTSGMRYFLSLGGFRVVGGNFRSTPTQAAAAEYVAWHDGTQWRPLTHQLSAKPAAMCEWNGRIIAAVPDQADAKTTLILSLDSVTSPWLELGRVRTDASLAQYGVMALTSEADRLIVTGAFQSVGGSAGRTDAAGVAEYRGGTWRTLGDPKGRRVLGPHLKNGVLHVIAEDTRTTKNTAYSRVKRWDDQTHTWTQVGSPFPGLAQDLFELHGALCVAPRRAAGDLSASPPVQPSILSDGDWRTLPIPTGMTLSVDDRTVAVASATTRTSVQLYRFTFSADFAGGPDDTGDGVIDGADVTRFTEWMASGDLRADLGSPAGPVGDDLLDENDWRIFFQLYDGGCR